ncbi:hypothetical protein ACOMHN_012868 [Nucella lapillus]
MANTTGKSVPRDAQVMAAILKDSGVVEYEPRLIHQMLDFTYQYVTDVLEDAKVYAQHANKKTIDTDDTKLAVQCRTDHSFTNPPPKELLQEMARQKNSQPLPPIKAYGGPRSISDRYCLTNPNYKLKSAKKPLSRIQFGLPAQPRIALPPQAKGLTVKGLGSGVKGLGSGGQSVAMLPKANASGTGATNQLTIIKPVTSAKPTIRINTGPAAGIGASGLAQIVTGTTPISTLSVTLPSSASAAVSSAVSQSITSGFGMLSNPLKRKAEDDDYDG